MVELGADLVVGSQSHCVQAMEVYLTNPIYYSTGDLLFDLFHKDTILDFSSNISHPKKFGFASNFNLSQFSLVIKIDIIDGKLFVNTILCKIKKGYNPRLLNPIKKKNWNKEFKKINDNLKNSIDIEKKRTMIEEILLKDLKNRGVL